MQYSPGHRLIHHSTAFREVGIGVPEGNSPNGTGPLTGSLIGLLAQESNASNPIQTFRRAVWDHGMAADRLAQGCRNWTAGQRAEGM